MMAVFLDSESGSAFRRIEAVKKNGSWVRVVILSLTMEIEGVEKS